MQYLLIYLDVYSCVLVEYAASNELPLQDCHISLSSVGDVLAMAWNTKMILFVCEYKAYIIAFIASSHVCAFL
jgi:hypothetical protein